MTGNAHRRAARQWQKATGESYTRARRQTDRTTTGSLAPPPQWAAPLIPPTDLARSALAALDRPLAAWRMDSYFYPDQFYAGIYVLDEELDPPLTPIEREITALGDRVEWRIECVFQPHEESLPENVEAYESGVAKVGGRFINPKCLDDYTTLAYGFAEAAGWIDPEEDPDSYYGTSDPDDDAEPVLDVDPLGFSAALQWASAGIYVLQQSLPRPFLDCLPYAVIGNRPANRLTYAYAILTALKDRQQAERWFKALVFMNPEDNMGARFHLPNRSESTGTAQA